MKIITFLRNLKHLPTAIAVRYLSRQLRIDPGLYQAWHANIAMPIFDSTRQHPNSWPIQDGGVAIAVRYMPIEQANHIASILMHHLFNTPSLNHFYTTINPKPGHIAICGHIKKFKGKFNPSLPICHRCIDTAKRFKLPPTEHT